MAAALPVVSNPLVARPIFGRFSSPLTFGIVGMPRVGKTALFDAMSDPGIVVDNTGSMTKAAGMVVQNPDLDWIFEHYHSEQKVGALIHTIDTPALERGARFGMGNGNSFLEEIQKCDAILHVLRAFEDNNITHVDGTLDLVRDVECIDQELILKDSEFLSTRRYDLTNLLRKGLEKKIDFEHKLCAKALYLLRNGMGIRLGEWTEAEMVILESYHLLTAKPMVYLINLSEEDYRAQNTTPASKFIKWVKKNGSERAVAFSSKLFSMPDEVALGMLPKIIKAGRVACHIMHFFTADATEAKCWQIRDGTKAHVAARSLGGNFRTVKVMKLTDLREHGSEAAVLAAGRQRDQPMAYAICDGDIILFQS